MDRRARTRRLIELGGLVDRSGIEAAVLAVEPDARAVILGALLELADELRGPSSSGRVAAWRERGRVGLRAEPATAPGPVEVSA